LRPQAFNVPNDRAVRPFRQPVVPAGDTRKHVFGGFQKCCYPYQRFQSNEEREFAVLIDSNNEAGVLRWMKPGAGQFRIEYANGQSYEPDFVVETRSQKLIVKIKAANEMDDPIVQAKTRAATKWVERANAHAQENGGKPWACVLVPHDVVLPSATLKGLLARHVQRNGRSISYSIRETNTLCRSSNAITAGRLMTGRSYGKTAESSLILGKRQSDTSSVQSYVHPEQHEPSTAA
jgi:type III restriction enzyme